MANNQIRFGVGLDVDKSGLNSLKSELNSLSKMSLGDVMKINKSNLEEAKTQLNTIRSTVSSVQSALGKAFNQKLNTINVQTFNNEINKTKGGLQQIYQNLQLAGAQGTNVFRSLANQVTSTNVQLKQSHALLDKMATTLGNTIKWNMASSAINALSGSIQQAYGYVKALDGSLNDIQIVTQKSSDEMAQFAKNANDAAKNLGTTTVDYTKSALTFYQQGLSDEEVQARADLTNKVANASGLNADDAAEYVTAVLNGYKVGSEEAEKAMDVLANVGAHTASSLSELSEAMSKVSSTASTMGVSEKQLAASLATVIQTTRQDASTVGTAFKTIYMRISDIKAGTEDAEVTLGNYTKQMAEMGVNVLDNTGELRDLGEVMEEIGSGWANMSREQQIALARTMAGTRQANNLLALFDNWDTYSEALGYATDATGTLQKQQDTYMESTEAHLNQLKASWEDVYDSMLDKDTINTIADGFSKVGDAIATLIDSIGGGGPMLASLGAIAMQVFSKQIANSINTTINNLAIAKDNVNQLKQSMIVLEEIRGIPDLDPAIKQLLDMKDAMYQLSQNMTKEQFDEIQQSLTGFTEASNKVANYREAIKLLEEKMYDLSGSAEKTEENILNVQTAMESNVAVIKQTKTQVDNAAEALSKFKSTKVEAINDENWIAAANSMDVLEKALKDGTLEAAVSKETFERLTKAIDAYHIAIKDNIKDGEFTNQEAVASAMQKTLTIFGGNLNNSLESTKILMGQIADEGTLSSESISNLAEAALREAENNKAKAVEILQASAGDQIIQSLTKITGSITSVAFAIQNLKNIGNIWNDEDLTTGEKILQTVTNLGMSLPMLFSGISGVVKGYKTITSAKTAYAAASTLVAGAEEAQTIATEGVTAAQLKLNAAMAANTIGMILIALTSLIAVISIFVDKIKEAEEQYKKNLKETTDNALAIEEETKNVNDLYNSYKNALKIYQDTKGNSDELRDAALNLAEALGVQIDTLDLLSDGYDNLNSKILESREIQAKTALDKAQKGAESARKQVVMNASSANAIDKNRREFSFNLGASDRDKADQKANQYLLEAMDSSGVDYTHQVDLGYFIGAAETSWFSIAEEDFITAYQAIQEAYETMGKKMSASDLKDSELYGAIGEWLKDNDEYFDKYIQLQEDVGTYASQFAEAQAALGAADFDITEIDSMDKFKSYRDQYIEQLRSALGGDENIIYDTELYESTGDYLNYLADKYLGTIDYIQEYAEAFNIKESLKDRLFAGLTDDNNGAAKRYIQNYLDSLSEEDFRLIATIGIDEEATVAEVKKTLELAKIRAQESLSGDVSNAIGTVLTGFNDNKITSSESKEYAAAQGVLDEYLSITEGIHGATTAAEEWEQVSRQGTLAQVEYLEDLREAQSSYGVVTEESLKHEAETDQERWQEKQARLLEEKEAMDDLSKKLKDYEDLQKEDNFDETSDKATALFESTEAYEKAHQEHLKYLADVDETETALEELDEKIKNADWSMEVDMSNVQEILSVGDNVLSEAEKIKQAAELIGEGFQVAASDADALAEIFPELYENATVTADGIVHLDQTTVQDLLGNQKAILDGDVTTSVAIIDNQIAQLEAKKTAAEAELQLWQSMAEGELELDKNLLEAMAGGQEDFTDYLIQCGVDAAEADNAVKKAMAGNYDELNRIAAEVANNMDSNLVQGIQDAANNTQSNAGNMVTSLMSVFRAAQQTALAVQGIGSGNVQGTEVSGAGGGSTGGVGFSANATNAIFTMSDDYAATKTGSFISNKINSVQLDISQYTSAIAKLQALKAKLQANQRDTNAALDGASSGTGGKVNNNNKSGSGSGGKNKGSSSDKEKEANYIEQLTDEADTYHDIDIEIKNITNDLNKLQKEQDKLTGKALIDNLNKQLSILEKQKDAYAGKIELAKMEADAYQQALKSYGATFSSDGQIANYFSLLQDNLNKANNVIARYNNLSADAQTEEEKQKVEQAKKDYEALKALIDSYDTLINDTIPDLEDQITDALYKEIEIRITEFDMELQIHLDMGGAERDWNEFRKKVIEDVKDDNLLGQALGAKNDFISYYQTQNADGQVISSKGSVQTGTNKVNDILNELAIMDAGGHSSIYSAYDANTDTWVDDRKSALEDLESTYKQLISDMTALKDLEDDVKQAFLDSIDAVQDTYDKQSEIYKFFGDQIEHDMKMIQLLYGEDAYGKLADYYDKQIESDKVQVSNLQNQVAYWKQLMDAARDAGDTEAYEKYRDNWMKSVEDLNSTIEQWADNLTTQYANTIKKIIDELNNALTNSKGLTYIDEELNLLNDNADTYLDTINAAYSLQKLQNMWQEGIDNTDSIAGQRELNTLMEQQLTYLKEKGELTQYDIDRAELEYQIALKQIALQEAQQNKSTMRLKKDANGNYSYQYVSDESAIADAQKELADAKNELYNFDKSAYQNNLNEIYSVWNEFQEKIAQAYVDYADDQEKLSEMVALYQEQYGEKINRLTEGNLTIRSNLYNSAFTELADLYNTNISAFQQMAFAEKDILMNDLIPQWDSGVQEMADKIAGEGGFQEACKQVFEGLKEAADEYNEKQREIGQVSNEVSQQIHSEQETLQTEADTAISLAQQERDAIAGVRTEVQGLITDYKAAEQAAIAATKAAYNYWQQEQANAASTSNGAGNSNFGENGSDSESSDSNSSGSGSNLGSGSGKTATSDIIKGIAAAIWCEDNNGWGNGLDCRQKLTSKFDASTASQVQSYINAHADNGDLYSYWANQLHKNASAYHYDRFYRGGLANYTGPAWVDGSPSNPEMVLNPSDTSNMLNAVSVLRGIVDNLGSSALASAAALLNGLGSNGVDNNSNSQEPLEQTVYITASFEGQTEADQIQTALNNLINVASQRAYHSKK